MSMAKANTWLDNHAITCPVLNGRWHPRTCQYVKKDVRIISHYRMEWDDGDFVDSKYNPCEGCKEHCDG